MRIHLYLTEVLWLLQACRDTWVANLKDLFPWNQILACKPPLLCFSVSLREERVDGEADLHINLSTLYLHGWETTKVRLWYLSVAAAATKSYQSCPTLCDPIDGSPTGSSVPGILQARILEWVAISFSKAWKWKLKVKSLSRVQLLATPWTSLPGSSIHGILQARILEWVAIAFSLPNLGTVDVGWLDYKMLYLERIAIINTIND